MNRFLLTQAVDDGAMRSPEQQALRFSSQSLTYAELATRSNQVAQTLKAHGVQRGDRVGIYLNKSFESVVSIYGIMKAGGAYVPLDPFAPVDRICYVIPDCGIEILLTHDAKRDQLEEILAREVGVQTLLGPEETLDSGVETISWTELYQHASSAEMDLNLVEQDLAYILYTSGSTGVPKGIMHTHRSGLSFAEWASATYSLKPDDILSNHAPLHFDLSTFDIFASHIAGATTVIIPEAITKFPASMSKLMQDERISVWYSVPFALIQLLLHGQLEKRDLGALRWVLFAGEPFPTKHLRELMNLLPGPRFSNLFGPTETNVCTYYHVDPIPATSDEPIPIGKPCANVEPLVVNEQDHPVPPGESGELLIRGGVVMRGYWGQAEKTAAGFFRRPVFSFLEDPFYRTGDLVRRNVDGNFEYLGRKDRQIKTRGYRVELDEIEVALLSMEGVEEAAAFAVPDGQGSNLIEAAVIPYAGMELDSDTMLSVLAKKLPAYALPARIHVTQSFPRTSTGKIDRITLQSQAIAVQSS